MNDNISREEIDDSQNTTVIKLNKVPLKSEREQNKRRHKIVIAIIVSIVLSLLIGTTFGYGIGRRVSNEPIASASTSAEINELINEYWLYGNEYENLDETLKNKSLIGMSSFEEDPYTEYFTKEEAESFQQGVNMNITGIGVLMNSDMNNNVIIEKVYKNTPAEESGLLAGDIFYEINGESVLGLGTDGVRDVVLGDENTKVNISIKRGEEIIDFEITRRKIDFSAYGENRGDYYYLNIVSFGEETNLLVAKYLNEMKEENLNNIVIDLRDNGGGYLITASRLLGMFLDKDAVCLIEEFKNGAQNIEYVSGKKYDNIEKIVILQNENTASAAEVFIMALKEQHPNVMTVGTTSFGKGVVQSQFDLKDGGVLKLTTSKWLSGNGVWVNGKGINPDYEVNIPEFFRYEFEAVNDGENLTVGDSSNIVKSIRLGLEYLGYETSDYETYFDDSLKDAIKRYQTDNNLKVDGMITSDLQISIISKAKHLYNDAFETYDPQMIEAIKRVNE